MRVRAPSLRSRRSAASALSPDVSHEDAPEFHGAPSVRHIRDGPAFNLVVAAFICLFDSLDRGGRGRECFVARASPLRLALHGSENALELRLHLACDRLNFRALYQVKYAQRVRDLDVHRACDA